MKLFILGILLPFLNGVKMDKSTDNLLVNYVNVKAMDSLLKEVLEINASQ
ncbi:hypothetical protein [Algoriphagus sp. CAU 1675]|nr:hypothetical protein [Algoriphagus sp. CAU 1675]MDF2157110.1 hypothetical protein [Algoriphagus sp. CAU 1675]